MAEQIYVTKADGTKELFNPTKLETSLKKAGASSAVVTNILEQIGDTLITDTTTHDIYSRAFDLLNKEAYPTAIKYSIKRAVMELGPSGFPFEDFVAEIFKVKGFETKTDQTVKGFCVEHEIDVVAWNEEKLIMVEAKFHNELGTKSDLKVVLYVKARLDDLQKMKFNFGKERDINEFWLVTNTKFSSTAIEYGSCQGGLTMVGWNYPPVGNLHDMILDAKLHPITCLSSLNGSAKKILLDKGIVLCKTILDTPTVLDAANLSNDEKNKVIAEIKTL